MADGGQQGPTPTHQAAGIKVAAAAVSSIAAAVVVNPLDVIKVRMQAQAAAGSPSSQSQLHLSQYCMNSVPVRSVRALHRASTPTADKWHSLLSSQADLSKQHDAREAVRWRLSSPRITWQLAGLQAEPAYRPCLCALSGAGSLQLGSVGQLADGPAEQATGRLCIGQQTGQGRPSALSTLRDILRQEGVRGLYRGLESAMYMCASTVILYYPLYDSLIHQLTQPEAPQLGPAAPAVAGALARTFTAITSSPFEYIRTQQALASTGAGSTTWQVLRSHVTPSVQPGVTSIATGAGTPSAAWLAEQARSAAAVARALPTLWTGLGATLARDVSFAAMYWGMVEPIRSSLLPADKLHSTRLQLLSANLIAGAVAGAAAAAVTTPFDVAKTRLQVSEPGGRPSQSGSSLLYEMQAVLRQQGPRGLFVGCGARMLRCAGACSVVIASYEVLKSMLSQ